MIDRWAPVWLLAWFVLFSTNLLAAYSFRKSPWANIPLAVAIACGGGAWHHIRWYQFASGDLATFSDFEPQPAAIRGVVNSLPEIRPAPTFDPLQTAVPEERTLFELQVTSYRAGRRWVPASGNCSVVVEGQCEQLLPGDEVEIFGQLSRQLPAGNPGEFDFAHHNRADRRLTTIRATHAAGITRIQQGNVWNPQRMLARIRRGCREELSRRIPQRLSGFAAALLIGQRQELGMTRRDAFMRTNSMHFLAISGLHIGILAASLLLLLRMGWMPRRYALLSVGMLTLAYVALSGAQPPAIRSLVLVIVACIALGFVRPYVRLNVLSLAGLIVLALNPADLFRVGPQLSFLAVLTLLTIVPWCGRILAIRDPLRRLIHKHRSRPHQIVRCLAVLYVRATAVSLGVWFVTAPLVAARFHLISPLASPLSPVLWPLIAAALFSGFGVLIFSAWLPPAANGCAWVCELVLSWTDSIVRRGSQVSGGHFWVAGPDDWWLAGFYLLVCGWMIFRPRGRKAAIAGVMLVTWSVVGVYDAVTTAERPTGELRCTVLSMRHGCCVVVEFPDQRVLVYDAGRLGSARGAAQSISAFFWHRGITSIDVLVVSHNDADHFNAIPYLLDRQFKVERVHTSLGMHAGEQNGATAAFYNALQNHTITRSPLVAGDAILKDCSDNVRYSVRVLHPPQEDFPGTDNARSVVLLIEYAGRHILLPGDLESPGLEMLLASDPIDCDFILAPHHGSRGSDPPGFATWCTPEVTVISGGRAASAKSVVADYAAAGSRVFHTAESGAVTYHIGPDGHATVRTHLSPGGTFGQ